jgi:hypothetical protein
MSRTHISVLLLAQHGHALGPTMNENVSSDVGDVVCGPQCVETSFLLTGSAVEDCDGSDNKGYILARGSRAAPSYLYAGARFRMLVEEMPQRHE